MIRIQALSPFTYDYKGNIRNFQAGEFYHLDPVKHKEELMHILSDQFPFKQYIYYNKALIDQELLRQIKKEEGFEKLPNTPVGTNITKNKLTNITPAKMEIPVEEAKPNYFAQQVDDSKIFNRTTNGITRNTITELPAEQEPVVNEDSLVDFNLSINDFEEETPKRVQGVSNNELDFSVKLEQEAQESKVEEKAAAPVLVVPDSPLVDQSQLRRLELDKLHWRRLQDIAEQYSIEYTDKDKVIQEVITFELNNQIITS